MTARTLAMRKTLFDRARRYAMRVTTNSWYADEGKQHPIYTVDHIAAAWLDGHQAGRRHRDRGQSVVQCGYPADPQEKVLCTFPACHEGKHSWEAK